MDQELSRLTDALGQPCEIARAEAAEKLSRLEPTRVRGAALALVEASADRSEAVREAAVSALEGMGPPDVGLLDGLIRLLGDPQPDPAYWAATLIGRLGPEAAAAGPALVAVIEASPHPQVRRRSAWALDKVRPGSPHGDSNR
ncbi:MAG: HEAT repeat domain-containing protein [Thermoguttaceae bacterium]